LGGGINRITTTSRRNKQVPGNILIACTKKYLFAAVKLKLKFAIELQAVYLQGTTYLRTPLFGMIPVVTLFVICAGAVGLTPLAK